MPLSPRGCGAFILAALCTVSCGDGIVRPTTTLIIPYPKVSCPAPVSVTLPLGASSAAVSFGAATTTGGTAPVNTTCAPGSGSTFAAGITPVTCTAVDAVNRRDSCSFNVTVVRPPVLNVRTILAYGDSITAGQIPDPNEYRLSAPRYIVRLDQSYPAALVKRLRERYVGNSVERVDAVAVGANNVTDCNVNNPLPVGPNLIVVVNAGCNGEAAQAPGTPTRFQNKINYYRPDLILLMEGTNDLDSANPTGSVSAGVESVRTLATIARNRNIPVIVSTIAPQVPGKLTHGGSPELVKPFNDLLRLAVPGAGAGLVDGWAALNLNLDLFMSPYDGLHPTADGYAELARVWFDEIVRVYEPKTTLTSDVN